MIRVIRAIRAISVIRVIRVIRAIRVIRVIRAIRAIRVIRDQVGHGAEDYKRGAHQLQLGCTGRLRVGALCACCACVLDTAHVHNTQHTCDR